MSGVPVSLDSDDVETLLFATGAIKGVESALAQNRRDPLAAKANAKLTAAHDRVANAWRDATRGRAFPERYRDPTEAELQELLYVHGQGSRFVVVPHGAAPVRASLGYWRPLMVLGFVEYGVEQNVIAWSSSGEVTHGRPAQTWVRLTSRGHSAVDREIESQALTRQADAAAALIKLVADKQ